MKSEDLLKAFQEIDPAFLDEAETRILTAEEMKHEAPAVRRQREETAMSQNKLFHLLTGAAAVIALCSIAVAGWAALRPDSVWVASQPADSSAVSDTETGTTVTAQQTDSVRSGTTETEASQMTTVITLPQEDFVEVKETETPAESEKTPTSYGMSFRTNIDGHSILIPAELPSAGEKIKLEVCSSLQIANIDCESAAMRLFVIQDGELLPVALTEDGEPKLWQQYELEITMPQDAKSISFDENETSVSVWVTPKHRTEYSQLTVVQTYAPAEYQNPELLKLSSRYFINVTHQSSHTLHTNEIVPDETTEIAYASPEDYIDCPESVQIAKQGTYDGCGIGRIMDYEANVPHRYNVNGESGSNVKLSRDAVYIKLHLDFERLQQSCIGDKTPEEAFYPVVDGMYLLVLCDGIPIKCFDGKYALRIDTPVNEKTLNYNLTLDENVTNGTHTFTPICVGNWNGPTDQKHYLYRLPSSFNNELCIE